MIVSREPEMHRALLGSVCVWISVMTQSYKICGEFKVNSGLKSNIKCSFAPSQEHVLVDRFWDQCDHYLCFDLMAGKCNCFHVSYLPPDEFTKF